MITISFSDATQDNVCLLFTYSSFAALWLLQLI